MNDFYNGYNRVVFETPEERQQKIKKQRSLFSRVFLALVIYIVAARTVSAATYLILEHALSAEQYAKVAASSIWYMFISCGAQYLIAFPIFRCVLIGTDTVKNKKSEKLSGTEFFLLFAIGETLMYAGNFIGNLFNSMVGSATGVMPENEIVALVNETPIWLTFLCVVILAPIVEELIFRKLMIDRLSIYGDKMAIIFSAVAFGLMHGNLYQFFYATLLGALFGYVYTKTRSVRYTVYMHMLVNFIGSIVVLPVEKALVELYEILEVAARGEPINILALIVSGTILLVYSNLQYGLIIGGILALTQYIRKKKIFISPDKEIFLPDNEIAKNGVVNVGAILFLLLTVVTVFKNLL